MDNNNITQVEDMADDIPNEVVPKVVCTNCGAELVANQNFCPNCGRKIGGAENNSTEIIENQSNIDNAQPIPKKNKLPIIIGTVVAVALIAVVGIKFISNLMTNPEDYMSKGDYQKAYEIANTDEEKNEVKAENLAAVISADIIDDYLKDPSSFVLRDVYFCDESSIALKVNANNSFGASVSAYWVYTWSDDDQKWKYGDSVSDLTKEEHTKYNSDDYYEIELDNAARDLINLDIEIGTKLSKDAIERINSMFEEDTLDDVELLTE